MGGGAQHAGGRPGFNDLPGVEHVQGFTTSGDEPEVVGDEQQRHAVRLDERIEQIENFGLRRHVERGGRLVGDQQPRPAGQRHGEHDALLHAAAELAGIGLQQRLGMG